MITPRRAALIERAKAFADFFNEVHADLRATEAGLADLAANLPADAPPDVRALVAGLQKATAGYLRILAATKPLVLNVFKLA